MLARLARLSERMQREEALLGGQLTPASLLCALEERRAVFIEQDETIVAFGALWAREGSVELGSLWVASDCRNQRLGSRIFASLIDQASHEQPLFLITHNERVIHLAVKHGLAESTAPEWYAHVPVVATCGPCDRLPEAEKPRCPFRAVQHECRLFVRS